MDVQKTTKAQLAARLKAARERAHISVEDAAAAAGVQPVAVRRWERGTAALPSLIEFTQLLHAYGVTASDVLYDEGPRMLSSQQAIELAQAARQFSPSLRARVDVLLAMHAKGVEPVWKRG
jgi:transcriptional regulator with XRE-family HTH domain